MREKKFICICGLIVGAAVLVSIMMWSTGCNMQLFDSTFKFDKAIISLPDGTVIEGKVDSWLDFDSSDTIQVKIDGVSYYTHSSNVVLISDKTNN